MLVTPDKVDEFLAACKESRILAVDTETNYTDQHHNRFLVGVSICTETEQTFYVPVGHTAKQGSLFDGHVLNLPWAFTIIADAIGQATDLVFHNAKFDLTVLEIAGIEVYGDQAIWDTMLISHLLDEYPPHGLKPLAKSLLGMEEAPELQKQIKSLAKHYGWEGIHPAAMSLYAEQDALMTMRLYKLLLPKLHEQELQYVYSQDIIFMEFLRQIERTGVLLDLDLAHDRSQVAESRMAQIRHEIGFEPTKSRLLIDKLYGEPPEGLGLKPSSFTPSGAIQVDEAVLTKINHPLAGLVLEYRGLLKAKSTWYDGFGEKADLAGRLHPNFKQHGTLTGRLSCENPNLQQIPREGSRVKDLFRAPEGYELWEFDFSQIELRLAAVYAQETSLLEAFKAGRDVHQEVADALGISRYEAKTINFAMLYGAGAGKLAEQLGITQKAAYELLVQYRKQYPNLPIVSDKAANAAASKGYVTYWDGHRRHFKYTSEYHKAFNSVLQGGAFQIVKRAGLALYEHGYTVVNQVHDAYWLELESPGENLVGDIKYCMSNWTEEMFELHFPVDAKRLD